MHNDIKKALEVLRNGGVILYPTDTIWGLGCDATNEEAVQRIYEIKQRADHKSMIILMDNINRLPSFVNDIPDVAYDVIEFSEKPLTIILEDAKALAKNVINKDDGSVAIRITKEKFTQQLIQQFKKPIVSTSANISGDPSPAIFDEISDKIISSVDYVVEYRQNDLSKSTPSGILKIGKNLSITIIRK
ncbi:MAG: L-threonylcarbamoyladenylate synthase [Salinivirgaceae bacterium]|jgi:L-threonylcarbamoyladenylate synthase|nr:L-threonylcarbamoyladenylate synthase [Salinivirgaceae bacterium]